MTYSFEHYEMREYLSSKYSNNRSPISRIRNNLVSAINEFGSTPKAILVILDGDITKSIHATDELQNTITIGKLTEWLLREFDRTIECMLDVLPQKAKRDGQPHVIWIQPPTHKYFTNNNNTKRTILGNCLGTVVKLYKNMSALHMLKVWDHEDGNAVLFDSTRYTAQGLINYWMSVDSAFRFWDVAIFPKSSNQSRKRRSKDQYKWKNPNTYTT